MVLNAGQSTGEDEDIIWQADLFGSCVAESADEALIALP